MRPSGSSSPNESARPGDASGRPDQRTFRGRSLSEVLLQIKQELGEDAVAVDVRHGRTGGVGGFFAQRCVEVDAVPAASTVTASAGADFDAVPGARVVAVPDGVGLDAVPGARVVAVPDGAGLDAVPGARVVAVPDGVGLDAVPGARVVAVPDGVGFDALLAAASAPAEGPVAIADVPGSWEQLIEDGRPSGADPASGAPGAGGAAALAAMFVPDAAPAAPVPPQAGAAAAAAAPVAAPIPLPASAAAAASPAAAPCRPPAPTSAAAVSAPLVPVAPAWPDAAVAIHRALTEKGMDTGLVAEIVGEAVDHLLPFSSEGALRPLVAGQLARCLPPLPRRRRGRVVIGFVGAGGAGKTRCVARLALAYARRGDRPVACLTLRPKDRGAELMTDVSPMGAAVHATDDVACARAFLEVLDERAVVVVDTPGVSPKAEAELRRLAGELRQLQLDECHLALPATLSPWAAAELVRGTTALGVGALAVTHADETDHLGAAIGAAIDARLPISYVARGGGARVGLRPALVEALALELVG